MDSPEFTAEQWWVAVLGNLLAWARLREHESGIADIFDSSGQTLIYDSLDTARAALLDAEFRQWEGLDADDARKLGFALDRIAPPVAENDEQLRPLMMQPLR